VIPPGATTLALIDARRSRVMIVGWIATLAAVSGVSASATVSLYSTASALAKASSAFNLSQALVALFGRIYDEHSIGAIATIKLSGFGAVFVAVFSAVLVVRHTRADEEAGRRELVGSARVAREAPVVAVLMVTGVALAALCVATTLALIAGRLDATGALCFGLAWAGCGLVYAAVAAFCAQVSVTSRGALTLAVATIGVGYVLRALGDTAGSAWQWLRWLSPFGWAQQMRPFAGDRFWPLLISLTVAAAIAAAAIRLQRRRDLGAGLLVARAGPSRAAGTLRGPLSLAWRLHGGATWSWIGGFAFFGLVLGGLTLSLHSFLTSPSAREFVRRLGGLARVTDAFLVVEMRYGAILAAAFAIQAVLRIRGGELDGSAEKILASSTSRWRWAGADTTVADLGASALLLALGVAAGASYALSAHRAVEVGRMTGAAIVQLPAVWLVASLALLVVAFLPRYAAAAWAILAAVVVLGEVGPLLRVDHWVLDISPFTHIPRLPGGSMDWTSVGVLTAAATALTTLGLAGLRYRDLDVH
jgi:ABC-2 type transport system permease protein